MLHWERLLRLRFFILEKLNVKTLPYSRHPTNSVIFLYFVTSKTYQNFSSVEKFASYDEPQKENLPVQSSLHSPFLVHAKKVHSEKYTRMARQAIRPHKDWSRQDARAGNRLKGGRLIRPRRRNEMKVSSLSVVKASARLAVLRQPEFKFRDGNSGISCAK